MFTLFSFGFGFSLISYRWWRRTSSRLYRTLIIVPISPIVLLSIGVGLDPGAEVASPIQTVFILSGGILMMGLSGFAAVIPAKALESPKEQATGKFI